MEKKEIIKQINELYAKLEEKGIPVFSCIMEYLPNYEVHVNVPNPSQISDHIWMDAITNLTTVWHNLNHKGEKLEWVEPKQTN